MYVILVMDMPSKCTECPLLNSSDECIVQDEDTNFIADSFDALRQGCPLKEMPEKKECPPMTGANFEAGWNACIDEILKGVFKMAAGKCKSAYHTDEYHGYGCGITEGMCMFYLSR